MGSFTHLKFVWLLMIALSPLAGKARDGGNSSAGGGSTSRLMGRPIHYPTISPAFDSSRSLRESEFLRYVDQELKQDLITEITTWDARKIDVLLSRLPEELKKRAKTFLTTQRDLLFEDITTTIYFPTDFEIVIGSAEKDASTRHQVGDPVLFNLKRISQIEFLSDPLQLSPEFSRQPSLKELKPSLQALFFHEHVRHFGFQDDDYQLAHIMTIAKSSTLLSTFQFTGAEFWRKLNLTIIAKALQPLSNRLLLCATEFGGVGCDQIANLTLGQILKEDFKKSDVGKTILIQIDHELITAGVYLSLQKLQDLMNRLHESSQEPYFSKLTIQAIAAMIDSEKAWCTIWIPGSCS